MFAIRSKIPFVASRSRSERSFWSATNIPCSSRARRSRSIARSFLAESDITTACFSRSAWSLSNSDFFTSSCFCFSSKSFLSRPFAAFPSSTSLSARWRSTTPSFCSARPIAGARASARRRVVWRVVRMGVSFGQLEEVADRELEVEGIVDVAPRHHVLAAVQGEAPLEAERADRAEPAQAEADRLVQRPVDRRVGVRPLREGVPPVGEEHALDARLAEDRELELEVQDGLLVAPDRGLARRRDGIRERGRDVLRRRDGEIPVAADGVDPAHVELLGDRDLVARVPVADEAEGQLPARDEAAPDGMGVPRVEGEIRRRELARGRDEEPARREEAVVPLVPLEREACRARRAGGELALVGGAEAGRRDVHLLVRVRREEAHVLEVARERPPGREPGELVAPRERAADRLAGERRVDALGAVQVEREGPARVEEVRLDELDLVQLPDLRPLDLQREGLAPPEEVLLRDLAGEDEVLVGGEPRPDLEGAGRALLHLDHRHDLVVARPRLRRDLGGLEEAERVHALLRGAHPGPAEPLALVDPELAADHLVTRLLVADDLDALEAHHLPGLNLEGDIEDPLLGVGGGERRDVRVGVAEVLVHVAHCEEVCGDVRAREELAAPRLEQLAELRLLLEELSLERDLPDGVTLALLDRDGDVDEVAVRRERDRGRRHLH